MQQVRVLAEDYVEHTDGLTWQSLVTNYCIQVVPDGPSNLGPYREEHGRCVLRPRERTRPRRGSAAPVLKLANSPAITPHPKRGDGIDMSRNTQRLRVPTPGDAGIREFVISYQYVKEPLVADESARLFQPCRFFGPLTFTSGE